ncbi:hypothetical protein FLSI110296_07280 [Flavobacterium sinopsychrotolerans]|jgi:hypothetical protein|uniref:Uncharacterized protein n=1 Tax=Flavobacterium sinopsychrotolerans TaxID=604089 RepID=A0A1H8KL84_9FLAO|nr:hypothetical protein SAMN04487942_1229 [Flavobacterium sinopsychrotolerans]
MLKLKKEAYFLGAKDLVLFVAIVPAVIPIFLFLKKEQKGFSLPSGLSNNMFLCF